MSASAKYDLVKLPVPRKLPVVSVYIEIKAPETIPDTEPVNTDDMETVQSLVAQTKFGPLVLNKTTSVIDVIAFFEVSYRILCRFSSFF